ncbi:hypothetical protein IW150_006387 [Coemansia sp. RSA 2607]|nr:hypothetical protein IW150_006387 [Coemansia sp. RSA 2607]
MAISRAIDVSPNSPMKLKLSIKLSFGIFTGIYMATGISALVVGGYFLGTKKYTRQTIIVTDNVLRSLLAAGVYIILNAFVGIAGALSPLKRKNMIVAFIWLVFIAILVETGVGIWLWIRTLDINDLYGHNWRNLWSDSIKREFQDQGTCCGYLGPNDSPISDSEYCKNPNAYGCMIAVQQYAQNYLGYIYTCLFSFVFIDIAALLSGMVLLVIRNDEERWRWSRANAIFKSMKKLKSSATLNGDMQEYRIPSANSSEKR